MYKHFYVSAVPEMYGGNIPSDAVDLLDTHTFGTIEISGLYRPAADDYITALGGVDASYYGGMSVKYREIKLNLDAQTDIQRMRLYHVLPYGLSRRFWIETNAGIFWIDGYVTGMPEGSSNNEIIANLDVTIKCPYPWFRSLHAHSVVIQPFFRESTNGTRPYDDEWPTGDELFHIEQNGDIDAGIQIYAERIESHSGAKMYGSLFGLYDSNGNRVTFKPDITTGRDIIDYSAGKVLLIDTTPGTTRWESLVSKSTGLATLADVSFTGDSVLVDAFNGNDIAFAFLNYVDYRSYYRVTATWFDTWSGI